MSYGIGPEHGNEETGRPAPSKRPKPSDSLNPGPLRFLARMSLDPLSIIFTVVAGIAQGVTKAVLEWRERRKAAKAQKPAKAGKKKPPP